MLVDLVMQGGALVEVWPGSASWLMQEPGETIVPSPLERPFWIIFDWVVYGIAAIALSGAAWLSGRPRNGRDRDAPEREPSGRDDRAGSHGLDRGEPDTDSANDGPPGGDQNTP